jgi:hypothetical protein
VVLTVFKSDWLLDLASGWTSGDCRPGFGLAAFMSIIPFDADEPDDLNRLPLINSICTLYGEA